MTMELFLFRHGEAEPATAELPDARRGLTTKGRERFARGIAGLERLEVELERIYHSPLRRAVESTELLTPLLERGGETVVTPLLSQAPSPELLELLDGERVALVGHEPWLSELLAWLVFGPPSAQSDGRADLLDFKKGGVAWLGGEPEPGAMSLRAFLPPRALRRIARS